MEESENNQTPLREAIISFFYRSEVKDEELEKARKALEHHYPERKLVHPVSFRIISLQERDVPVHFSADAKRGVQIRADAFIFSRRAPYPGWSKMQEEARSAWSICRPLLGELNFRTLGVRFANLLRFQGAVDDLGRYLTSVPTLPKLKEGSVESFYQRWSINLPKRGSYARITQASRPPHTSGRQRVLLDIDVTARRLTTLGEEDLWAEIEYLRGAGHGIFRESLTDLGYESVQKQ